MKKNLLTICICCFTCIAFSQPCVTYEGLGPVYPKFGINAFGQPSSSMPIVPLYWNRYYKANETTGQIEPLTCAYTGDPNLLEFGFCACIMTDFYFRKVTPPCDPTPCGGDLDLPLLPKTNNSSGSSNWSAGATWIAAQVPDIASSMAVMLSKSTVIDANLSFPANHWLLLAAGTTTLQPGKTITLNSALQIKPAAIFENFGTVKGNGQIFGSISNSGILSPGNSPGRLSIIGNYTATATAVHQMEIAAANLYDTITIGENIAAPGGVAILNGTLIVSLLNGFAPSSGETYKIMTYTSATGTFTNVNLPALRSGLSWVINYNATDITLQVTGLLPVTISSFRADRKDAGIQLEWTTESEINVKNYEIEKSADGVSFNKAASVGASNGTSNRYSWLDASPLNGNNYYRIKAIDLDGRFKHSKILLVSSGSSNKLSVYPNPVRRGGTLQVNLWNTMAGKLEIIDARGLVLYTKTGNLTGNITVPLARSWSAGQYVLKLIVAGKVTTQKILVQ